MTCSLRAEVTLPLSSFETDRFLLEALNCRVVGFGILLAWFAVDAVGSLGTYC